MNKVSVIIPAHNEEKYIGKCLDSIKTAASRIDLPIEIVVSLNRCTDKTEYIAESYGAVTVVEDQKNIASIRNTAVKASSGDILITIDADSWMTSNMFQEVLRYLRSGRYIGGGVRIIPERISLGIIFSMLMVLPYLLKARISAGMFWLLKNDFEAIGGFDEDHISVEDYFFGMKLRSLGLHNGLKYGTIRKAHIITSCRKFDKFGDWYLFRNPKMVHQIFSGINRKAADRFYYDLER
jgi:glycosyltransferase involved in cell wall biosynthesis